MDTLRSQIIETQKTRSDLMKWKLVLVATLASAAGIGTIGIDTNQEKKIFFEARYLLCFIPLICVYVDALYTHLSLRIRIIGEFFYRCKPKNKCECCDHEYEHFLNHLGQKNPYKPFESFVLHWSTIFLSVLVLLYGLYLILQKHDLVKNVLEKPVLEKQDSPIDVMLILAGLIGIFATYLIKHIQVTEKKYIEKEAKKWK